jgi:hypothetical protein
MYLFSLVVVLITFLSDSHGALSYTNKDRMDHVFNLLAASTTPLGSGDITEADPSHLSHGTVDNANIIPESDCALRAFTGEMATYIQPNSSRSNWTALSESALQMNQSNVSYGAYVFIENRLKQIVYLWSLSKSAELIILFDINFSRC